MNEKNIIKESRIQEVINSFITCARSREGDDYFDGEVSPSLPAFQDFKLG